MKINMKKEEVKNCIENFLKHYNTLKENLDELLSVFPSAFESDLFESIYIFGDEYIKLLADFVGIHEDAMFWFIYDNEQGKNEFEVNGVKIKNVDDFINFELIKGGDDNAEL